MTTLPLGLSTILRPLSPPVATTRLKLNASTLAFFLLRNLFPPFRVLKSLAITTLDILQRKVGRRWCLGETIFSIAETLLLILFIWNCVEAAVALQYSSTYVPLEPKGSTITPLKKSSPLTRSYYSSPSTPSQAQPRQLFRPSASPLSQISQSHLYQSQTPNLGTKPLDASTSSQPSSSISPSTARLLNLPLPVSPSNGFFYEQNYDTPIKTNVPGNAGRADNEFVLVDRNEKEWADNVWKGVIGKGGRVAL
ncbi:hypothetical protein L204_103918 [Cryptococcus depauperatus]|nr:hypothetical protein L204_03074 [Cryptococcus depauperatus CBS 7855]